MSKIESFLDAATDDKALRQHVISIHDDLETAHKILDSAASAAGAGAHRSEQVLLAVFHELRKYHSESGSAA
ncbi:hypothetical protein [Luteimonas sp. MC1782]|uniref:hypothetical protein n=1 Tax=Luteimonas sp. MC1782 TaxID=2760305 RepID=UPI001C724D54|nr:hypothetical protein [Luteimonas sp. MC1782]